MRFVRMSNYEELSREELGALREVASGIVHKPIAPSHAEKLLRLKLIYRLLGSYRVTFEGRQRLQEKPPSRDI